MGRVKRGGKKFSKVVFNNRKKQFSFTYAAGKKAMVHYSQLGIGSNVKESWIDRETNGQSVGVRFEDGTVDFIPYDQPLALVKDPDFLLQNQIEILTARIKEAIRERKISKRYLAEQLATSDNQIQRLLNPKILNKNLSQLYQIAALLGLELQISLKAA